MADNEARNEAEQQIFDRYLAAMHACQCGVQMLLSLGKAPFCSPKHLRVGVDSAHVSDAALVEVLISKGLITREEYFAELAKFAEADAASYRAQVAEALGTTPDKINLV